MHPTQHLPSQQELDTFAEDCERLQAGIDALLDDYRLLAANRKPTFAVDFSEIHSFLEPEKDEPLHRFQGDTVEDAQAVQRFVQDYLLFELPGQVVLLDAHRKELQGWYDHNLRGTINRVVRLAAPVERQAQDLLQSEDYKAVVSHHEQLARAEASAAALEELAEVIRVRAPAILQLLQEGASDKDRRFRLLRTRGGVRTVDAFGWADVRPDPAVRRHWTAQLDERRPHEDRRSANTLDAEAMATLAAINTTMRQPDDEVCLVTRSKDMLELFAAEVSGRVRKSRRPMLRHPRDLFALQTITSRTDLLRATTELRRMRASLQGFRAGYAQYRILAAHNPTAERAAQDELMRVKAKLDEVREQWRVNINYSAAATVRSDEFEATESNIALWQLGTLIEAAGDPEAALGRLIRNKLDSLSSEIADSYQYLGIAVQESADVISEPRDRPTASVDFSAPLALVSRRYWMPYALRLKSAEAGEWLERIDSGQQIGLVDVLQWYAGQFASPSRAEAVLIVAYLFASARQWHMADPYSELATVLAVDPEEQYEARLFRAFCLRGPPEADGHSFARALDILTGMLEDQASGAQRDPRVFKEYGTIILAWNTESRKHTYTGDRPPDAEHGLQSLRDALKLADPTTPRGSRLIADIYNNLCYFQLERGADGDRDAARAYLTRLRQAQLEVEPDEGKWDANITDTVAWATWRLTDHLSDAELIRLIESLERALNEAAPGLGEIGEHLGKLTAELDRRKEHTTG